MASSIKAIPKPAPLDRAFERKIEQFQRVCMRKHSQMGEFSKNLVTIASIVAAVWAGVVYSSFYIGSAAGLAIFCTLASIHYEYRDKTYANIAEALNGYLFRQFLHIRNYPLSIVHISQMYYEFAHTPPSQILNPSEQSPR